MALRRPRHAKISHNSLDVSHSPCGPPQPALWRRRGDRHTKAGASSDSQEQNTIILSSVSVPLDSSDRQKLHRMLRKLELENRPRFPCCGTPRRREGRTADSKKTAPPRLLSSHLISSHLVSSRPVSDPALQSMCSKPEKSIIRDRFNSGRMSLSHPHPNAKSACGRSFFPCNL